MKLEFRRGLGKTTMHVVETEPPWRVVRAFDAGEGAALVHLNNVSGGILSGDDLRLELEVGEGAEAQVTTTGATRIYRGSGARQTTAAKVFGFLEYLPDAVIPYARSRFSQASRVELAPGAGLFWWEVVSPGREAAGELFQYDSLSMEMMIFAEERPIVVERFELTGRPWLGPFTHFASFYVCFAGHFDWLALEARLRQISGEARWGVSALAAHGLIVRGMATRSRHLFAGLAEFWRIAKRELYGKDARLPRKLY
jgi:urease accessory protein